MEIKSAKFVISNTDINLLPKANYPEYAFVGRSNVGKSSLINCLCTRKHLAKTSSTPGKTRLINHFMINEEWYIVDLPGYGYAKVSKTQRSQFVSMITDYLERRTSLMNVFILLDMRIKPQKIDLEFMEYMGVQGIPFTILFTKCDKVNQKLFGQNMRLFKQELEARWEELPRMIYTSSVSGRGREEILSLIEWLNPSFKVPDKDFVE